jgi:hypothetical protein
MGFSAIRKNELMRKVTQFIILIGMIWALLPLATAYAQGPTATPVITTTPQIRPQSDGMTWLDPVLQQPTGPTICTGWLYYNLKSVLDSVLYPLFWFGGTTKSWNSITAEDMAASILAPISGFLGYITFFNGLTPAFTSLSTLLFLYLFILSIKASLSMIKWLKQILPAIG